ncbi:efflux RND transporter permease subunit [Prosthecobacter sp. SYSU 5D2]|uniref:efflux RND transporter permease subunit n=1 Tax=Prosthecobacter sp. SYSU 5D2 TaxID=3134134 RepID=UPI0031FF450C
MLNRLILWSLHHRAMIIGACVLILVMGARTVRELPVEVLPDLTKPTVTILTEAPGLAPEEVEALITQPIESSLMGVAGLTRLRSTSDISLSLVFAEFAWGTDIYRARQFVQERLAGARGTLPPDTQPFLTPVASLMGEILLVGVRSTDGKVPAMEVRSLADWTIRRRLQAIPGIAEVLNMGGGVKQLQIQPDPLKMQAHGVTFEDLERAVRESATNTTGGFLNAGPREIMVRNLAMTVNLEDFSRTVIRHADDRIVTIGDVAQVAWGVEPMRGDASVNGTRGVIMSVTKAPGFDTLTLTRQIEEALAGLQPTLPAGVEAIVLFRQADFIEHAIGNLQEAIRDGAIMVTIVIFLFLLNVRTTFITLMAMPLSFAITILVFQMLGISVNSMTLGGLAVAIGMVVDDAIVDVENVWRRLRQAGAGPPVLKGQPDPVRQQAHQLTIIANASGEVRNSILYATVLIILVFLPLLGLTGVEGRLFGPIAIATILSMLASFVVSLSVIPVLCSLLLKPKVGQEHHEGRFTAAFKWLLKNTILRLSLSQPFLIIGLTFMLLLAAAMLYPRMGQDFLPAFEEETALVSMTAAPGSSLEETNRMADVVESLIMQVPEVRQVGRRLGRAERGDHVVPISSAEMDVDFNATSGRSRAEILADIRDRIRTVPGTFSVLTGPLADRIGHMLSGVSAPVAIKIFGPDLETLRALGTQVQTLARTIPGFEDAKLDQQSFIPQLRIEADRDRAAAYGITPGRLNEVLSTLVGGQNVAELRDGQRTIGLAIRLPENLRDSAEKIASLPIETTRGPRIPLRLVAQVREAKGPNAIQREGSQRRFVVSIKPSARDVGTLVAQLQNKVAEKVTLPEGFFISYEGEFQAQQEATQRILILFAIVLLVILLLLWGYFRSLMLACQVLLNLPLALMGSLALTWLLVGNISIATLVGFIAVGGVAARNGIMMLSHYLHLMKHEGENFSRAMIERGTLERLVPVTMTALSAGIALIPLVLAAGEPGKEILHPVAVCIVGGLISSTLLDFAVTPAVFSVFGRRAAEKALRLAAPAAH